MRTNISLPEAQDIQSSIAFTLNSATFIPNPNVQAVMVNSHPTKRLQCLITGSVRATPIANATYLGCDGIGATVFTIGSGGDYNYFGSTTTSLPSTTFHFQRIVTLNPGTTTIRLGGQLGTASPTQNTNYGSLSVTPIGYIV